MPVNSRLTGLVLLLSLLGQAAMQPSQAADGMLDYVIVSRRGDTALLELRFACRNRYVDHVPSTRSQRVRISLNPVDRCEAGLAATPRRDLRRPAGRDLAHLEQVEFVHNVDGGALILHFDRPVSVTVQQGGNLNHLAIAVDVAEPTNVPVSPPVIAAAPVTDAPDARHRPRAEERARLATARAFGATTTTEPANDYAINLESSLVPIDLSYIDANRFPDALQLYATRIEIAEQTWHRLRLGFFPNEAEAEQVLASLRALYPEAWVVRVASEEQGLADATPVVSPAATAATNPAGDGLSAEKLADLAEQGRAAMLAGDNARAVQIYTRMLREPENEYSRQAQEFLGLARERNGQLAHATAEYRRYLMLYPEGADTERVRQRLAGIVAIDELEAEPVRVADRRDTPGRWDVYGGLAQYYRRDENQFGDRASITSQSSVLTDVDIAARRRGDRFDLASRAAIGNFYDLLGEGEGPGNSTRIYYLYADVIDSRSNTSMRLGRQRLRNSGVLGRFDGAQLSWQWRPNTRFNVVTGFPIDTSTDDINTDRSFYGFSTDLSSVFDLFDLSLFYNAQEFDGFQDRQAIGGEARYYDDARSLITLLDYDLSYGEVNSFVVLGNWAFTNRVTVNAMIDTRKSPLLTTRNALIGQPFASLGELVETFGVDGVRELARDRTGDMQTYSLGVSAPLADRFQVNADVTMMNYSGTLESANVPAIPATDGDFYYTLTLIGSGLLIEGDTSVFGVGYVDGSTASTLSLTVDTRYPLSRGFRFNPRMRVSLRELTRTQSEQWIAAPSLRLLYRFARRYQLDLEIGGEWSSQKIDNDAIDYNSYFIYAGYRADF